MADEQNDDLLNPDDIDALLQSAGADQGAASADESPQDEPAADANNLLSSGDIETLLNQSNDVASTPDQLLDQAESNLAAAISPDLTDPAAGPSAGPQPASFDFQPFDRSAPPAEPGNSDLDSLKDVELDVRIELGRAELLIEDVLRLKQGAVVPLDKLAGDPVDILVNGQIIARGEVLVLNDNFCVRVAEILAPDA